jgi:hypothetical protein
VLTALRHAVVQMMRACESGTGGFDAARYSCAQRMVEVSPAVHARTLEVCAGRVDEVARHVAARMGVDMADDPRPRLVAAVVTTGIQAAVIAWREVAPETPMSVLADQALTLLEEGLNYPSAA